MGPLWPPKCFLYVPIGPLCILWPYYLNLRSCLLDGNILIGLIKVRVLPYAVEHSGHYEGWVFSCCYFTARRGYETMHGALNYLENK